MYKTIREMDMQNGLLDNTIRHIRKF